MKYLDFNILFMMLFININCVLNANKIKIQNQSNDCIEFNNDTKKIYIESVLENSKNKNTTHFLFFSSNKKIVILNN